MRKLWNRFRRWLIVKLGGYLWPYPDTPVVIQKRQAPLVRVHAVHTFHPYELMGAPLAEAAVMSILARELVGQIVKDRLFTLQRSDDFAPDGITYRATLTLIAPGGEQDG